VPRFEVITLIRASRERCFDVSRDIDLHQESMAASGERAVAGRTSGLIQMDEEVTWRALHFGIVHEHQARITEYNRPSHFRDVMVRGRFKRFEHDHFFGHAAGVTTMRDVVTFESPLGPLGRIVDDLILSNYLEKLIRHRSQVIRLAAEKPD
jgi:ligand-binding SRPBCC domain-containing protein